MHPLKQSMMLCLISYHCLCECLPPCALCSWSSFFSWESHMCLLENSNTTLFIIFGDKLFITEFIKIALTLNNSDTRVAHSLLWMHLKLIINPLSMHILPFLLLCIVICLFNNAPFENHLSCNNFYFLQDKMEPLSLFLNFLQLTPLTKRHRIEAKESHKSDFFIVPKIKVLLAALILEWDCSYVFFFYYY